VKPDWATSDNSIRLYCADCLDVLPQLEAGSVDAVVTDPPYGVDLGRTSGSGSGHGLVRDGYEGFEDTYHNFVSEVAPRLNVCLDVAKRAAVFTGPHVHEQRKPDVIGGIFCPAGTGRHRWGFKTFLPVLFYGTAPRLNEGGRQTSCLSCATAEPNGHPCPKPLEWMQWLVATTSDSGDVVCDPFMGSGTTGVACIRTGRRFIGIEKEPKYFAIAVKRIEAELSRNALFEKPPQIVQRSLLGDSA
jgi:site-specific DNA-methyltransferase (adenine-specific)